LPDEQFHQITFGHDEYPHEETQSEKNIEPDLSERDTRIRPEEHNHRRSFREIERKEKERSQDREADSELVFI
jgi:hypothetical protein